MTRIGRVFADVGQAFQPDLKPPHESEAEGHSGQAGTPDLRDWRQSLAEAIREPAELIERLRLPAALLEPATRAAGLFPLLVPESYLRRMRPGDPRDPLLLQVLPLGDEEREVPGFTADALHEAGFRRAPGLLHKYAGRALLIAAGACAVNCRYCFRRHYPYGEEPRRWDDWQPALDAIATDDSLHEIILSGGDPLMLSDRRLLELCTAVDAISHLQRLRIHTRLPIVLPERLTAELLEGLSSLKTTVIFVVHANHPNEIAGDCAKTLRRMVRSGFTVLNQSVLLRGVNDNVDALAELCEKLANLGVMPYYLHQLDRVAGTAHFEVADDVGVALIAELRKRLPGYAVPALVREEPGELHKVPIGERSDGVVE
jgi:L-lysine 2,3-aminomutase